MHMCDFLLLLSDVLEKELGEINEEYEREIFVLSVFSFCGVSLWQWKS